MGLFDTFILKKGITCPICKRKKLKEFQSKALECRMETFKQGEKAVYYALRDRTKREEAQSMRRLKEKYPKLAESSIGKLCGIWRTADEVIEEVKDGSYGAHDWCENCKRLIYANAVIKEGIFIKMENPTPVK